MFRRIIEYIGDTNELNPDSDKWLCEECYDNLDQAHDVIDEGGDCCVECDECGREGWQ